MVGLGGGMTSPFRRVTHQPAHANGIRDLLDVVREWDRVRWIDSSSNRTTTASHQYNTITTTVTVTTSP
ncbi:hypothetical protein M0802_004356 [Mischocyttarus mexicanus]|nr:hypothetical protein M0802_004356 [Mischocyttarus mexicanus]